MEVTFRFISNQLTNQLRSAKKSVCVAVAWFTNEMLFELLLDLVKKGITVELLINNDHINNRKDGLDFNEFIALGGKFYFANSSKLMHHKFSIIDYKVVISGSYNWTYNAEFRNTENIISTNDIETVEKFQHEFQRLKSNGSFQPDKIIGAMDIASDYDVKKYLRDDYFYKSIAAEKIGNMTESLNAILTAQQLDATNQDIVQRISEVKEKIDNPKYHYHIEDGQFSFDFTEDRLIGNEGETVNHYTERLDDIDEFYILFINGFYIECIGNIERSFPVNKEEHESIKQQLLKMYDEY